MRDKTDIISGSEKTLSEVKLLCDKRGKRWTDIGFFSFEIRRTSVSKEKCFYFVFLSSRWCLRPVFTSNTLTHRVRGGECLSRRGSTRLVRGCEGRLAPFPASTHSYKIPPPPLKCPDNNGIIQSVHEGGNNHVHRCAFTYRSCNPSDWSLEYTDPAIPLAVDLMTYALPSWRWGFVTCCAWWCISRTEWPIYPD